MWLPSYLNLAVHNSNARGSSVDQILKAAAAALDDDTVHSVVLKNMLPPSGDPHDYTSLSKYFWPVLGADADTSPWGRRDGFVNPAAKDVQDYALFRKTAHAVNALSLAYQITNESLVDEGLREAWRGKARSRLLEWFCDEETRMRPRLVFGSVVKNLPSRDLKSTEWEGVPGAGTKEGILDLWPIAIVLKSVEGLQVDESTETCLQNWVSEYLTFLTTSPLALAERRRRNNHGVFYDVQYLGLLAFAMRRKPSLRDTARRYIHRTTIPRLLDQIAPDGSQPRELSRKTSWYYSFFALRGWVYVAGQTSLLDVDLWNVQEPGSNAPVLQNAFTFLLQHAFSSPPGVDWPVFDLKKTFTIHPQYRDLFYYAAEAYRVTEKEDDLSLRWRGWLAQIEQGRHGSKLSVGET